MICKLLRNVKMGFMHIMEILQLYFEWLMYSWKLCSSNAFNENIASYMWATIKKFVSKIPPENLKVVVIFNCDLSTWVRTPWQISKFWVYLLTCKLANWEWLWVALTNEILVWTQYKGKEEGRVPHFWRSAGLYHCIWMLASSFLQPSSADIRLSDRFTSVTLLWTSRSLGLTATRSSGSPLCRCSFWMLAPLIWQMATGTLLLLNL